MTTPSSMPRRSARNTAFTLIELMIVVAILGIIVAVGVPAFARAMKKEGLRKAVSDVVEACSHARAQAILTGLPTELVIRSDGSEIRMSVEQAARRTIDEHAVPDEPDRPRRRFSAFNRTLPDGVAFELLAVNFKDRMEADEARVLFYPNGTSDEFTVVLLSLDQERRLIRLDMVTALAEVENDPRRFLLRF